MLIYISVCSNAQINLLCSYTLCLQMLFLECKWHGTLQICQSWEMSSIGRFCGNCAFWKKFKGKKIWQRRHFYRKRTRQICVHRWWVTVPYSQAGLLVQPQCHDNIDVLDQSWLTLDSGEGIGIWSHRFVPTYLQRAGNCRWEDWGKEETIIYIFKKSYDCGLEIFPFLLARTLSPLSGLLITSLLEGE